LIESNPVYRKIIADKLKNNDSNMINKFNSSKALQEIKTGPIIGENNK